MTAGSAKGEMYFTVTWLQFGVLTVLLVSTASYFSLLLVIIPV